MQFLPAHRRLVLLVVAALFALGCASDPEPGLTAPVFPPAPIVVEPSVETEPAIPSPPAETTVPAEAAPPPETEASPAPQPDALQPAAPQPDVADVVVPAPAGSQVACLSIRQRIGQTIGVLANQQEIPNVVGLADAGEIGFVGLLGFPDANLGEVLATLQAGPIPVSIASDEEGGAVQRMQNVLGPLPSAQRMAETMSPEEVRATFADYARGMVELGVTIDFAPVLDTGGGPGIGDRSFSSDPAVVATYGAAAAQGLIDGGVLPVYKHFPGHGRASADSHLELPTTPPLAELRTLDLIPYETLLNPNVGVMIGHLSVPNLSDETPTSLSPKTISGLLRNEFGFTGLVFTDALGMGAIQNSYGTALAAELSLEAGADVALVNSANEVPGVIDALVARIDAGELSIETIDGTASRILEYKGVLDTVCP